MRVPEDHDLTLVFSYWPGLPEPLRDGVLALVRASSGGTDSSSDSVGASRRVSTGSRYLTVFL